MKKNTWKNCLRKCWSFCSGLNVLMSCQLSGVKYLSSFPSFFIWFSRINKWTDAYAVCLGNKPMLLVPLIAIVSVPGMCIYGSLSAVYGSSIWPLNSCSQWPMIDTFTVSLHSPYGRQWLPANAAGKLLAVWAAQGTACGLLEMVEMVVMIAHICMATYSQSSDVLVIPNICI